MESQANTVQITISARDTASEKIKQIEVSLAGLDKALQGAANGFSWLQGRITKTATQITVISEAFNKTFAALGKTVELMNLGAEALKAEEAFGNMAHGIGTGAEKGTLAPARGLYFSGRSRADRQFKKIVPRFVPRPIFARIKVAMCFVNN